MNPRINYEMSEQDLAELLEACKPVAAMLIGGSGPSSPQENANRAWATLGKKMGFESMTVQPIPGKGTRFFSAVPSENEAQRAEREAREAEAERQKRISELRIEIAERQTQLDALTSTQ